MAFVARVKELIKEKGISQKEFLETLGLGRNSFTHWSKYGNIPRHETLIKIAAYFGVSTDYLLGKTEERRPVESVAAITDDDLPPEALKELENYKEFLRLKYGKK